MSVLVPELKSQAPADEFSSIYEDTNKDTIVVHRKNGDFWFGLYGGSNFIRNFGELRIGNTADSDDNPFAKSLNFEGGSGSGYFMGLISEYIPPNKKWAGILKISLLDKRFSNTSTSPKNDSIFVYKNETELSYLTLSPSARYNFDDEGFYSFGGIDINLLIDHSSKTIKAFESSERIRETKNTSFDNAQHRLAMHLGIGYDIFMVDVNNRGRIRFSPYLSFETGTKILSDYNSSWNSIVGRLGIQVKFGFDKIKRDTIKFDPLKTPPPVYLASAQDERGIEFPSFELLRRPPAEEIAYVEIPQVKEETEPQDEIEIATPAEEETEKVDLVFNGPKRLVYPSSSSVDLTPEMKEYIDELVRYLKENPGVEVRIVGHSDNTGTLVENTRRSQRRAQKVEDYINSKGIPRGALLTRGQGSLNPIAPINTPAGRAQNRRVEITILQ